MINRKAHELTAQIDSVIDASRVLRRDWLNSLENPHTNIVGSEFNTCLKLLKNIKEAENELSYHIYKSLFSKGISPDEDELLEEYEKSFNPLNGIDDLEEKKVITGMMAVLKGLVTAQELFPLAQCIYTQHVVRDERGDIDGFYYDPTSYGDISTQYWGYKEVLQEAIDALEKGYPQD